MQFFFTWSITSGRENIPQFRYILEELKKYWDIFWEHIASDDISEFWETNLNPEDILSREKTKIEKSDLVFAELTTPSLWVWYLISYATSINKKVIVFYNRENTFKLSSIIKWDKLVEVYTYKNLDEIKNILKEIFKI